jgi:hypothetical protein
MAWTIKLDGTTVAVEDLPLADFELLARKHDINWYQLLASPGAYPTAFYEVIVLACAQAGVTPPDAPKTMGDVVRLVELLEMGDDRPDQWVDGSPLEEGPTTG